MLCGLDDECNGGVDESKCGDREDGNGNEHDNGFDVADVIMIMIMICVCGDTFEGNNFRGEPQKKKLIIKIIRKE